MRSEDLAKLIGVSRSTISRVINNYPDIPKETREKVWKAIEHYNYVPNASARKLAGARNNMIGIFVLDIKEGDTHHIKTTDNTLIHNNPFFSPVINAVVDQANKMDYYVLISTVYNKGDLNKVRNIFQQKMIDGAIFVGTQETDNEFIFNLIEQKYLVAMIDTSELHLNDYNAIYVNADNYGGSCKAIKHLIALGHTNIGIITGDLNKLSALERLRGYSNTLLENGLDMNNDAIYHGDFTEKSGYEGIKYILSLPNRPTAIFVCNDSMAVGVYKGINELGLSIPGDISIVGFDNAIFSSYLSPPLTTVNHSFSDIAKRATVLLIESIEKKEQRGIDEKIETILISRDSCKEIN